MTLDGYSGLFDDDINGAAARLDEQLRRAEPPVESVESVESAGGVPVVYPDDHEQAADGGIGPENGSRLRESNPRPTHYECVALAD